MKQYVSRRVSAICSIGAIHRFTAPTHQSFLNTRDLVRPPGSHVSEMMSENVTLHSLLLNAYYIYLRVSRSQYKSKYVC